MAPIFSLSHLPYLEITKPCPHVVYTGYHVTQIVACGVYTKPLPDVSDCAKALTSIFESTGLHSTTGTYGVPIVSDRDQEAALTAHAILAASKMSVMDAEDF